VVKLTTGAVGTAICAPAVHILFQVAYAERDAAMSKAETDWGLSHAQLDRTLLNLAFAAATSGRLREAMDYFSRASRGSARRRHRRRR
jgi:hypothetical protein